MPMLGTPPSTPSWMTRAAASRMPCTPWWMSLATASSTPWWMTLAAPYAISTAPIAMNAAPISSSAAYSSSCVTKTALTVNTAAKAVKVLTVGPELNAAKALRSPQAPTTAVGRAGPASSRSGPRTQTAAVTTPERATAPASPW